MLNKRTFTEELVAQKDLIKRQLEALKNNDKVNFLSALAEVIVFATTGFPGVGILSIATIKLAFSESSYTQMKKLIASFGDSLAEEQQYYLIAQTLEELFEQAILQIIQSQHNIKNEHSEQLQGLKEDFRNFREDFQRTLDHSGATVELDKQVVTNAARGLLINSSASKVDVKIREQEVSGEGSVGIEFK